MATLVYSAITSLDGYIEDKDGRFDWSMPDEEVHKFINDITRPVRIFLLGRRMYEVMVYWETAHTESDLLPHEHDFAQIWQAADKIVYSSTLESVASARTRIERTFEPVAVRRLKETANTDLSVAGPSFAAAAIAAGLVDEFHLFMTPVLVGGGKKAFPDDVLVKLELLDERRFRNGTVYLRYGIEPS